MSGFAVIYERAHANSDPRMLDRVMERLNHRGPDGSDILATRNVSMGHWHFWTTPEEIGERQPLEVKGLPFKIVLDGRLDNRSEIVAQLDADHSNLNKLSDAALILLSYRQWGKNCFERFVGEFALVIFDETTGELLCARDHLGDRTMFYESTDARIVIASEPWAVLGARNEKPVLEENTAAYFFAFNVPESGQTFFKNVFELLPAHFMSVDTSGHVTRRYWMPDPHKKIRYQTEEEYARHFLALLDESVRCRIRSTTPVGILMSGGLDSTSIACLAARAMAPESLTTISNIYDELKDCDEREYINTVREKWNTRSVQIPCDDAWTYKDWMNLPRNPNQPDTFLFSEAMERDYKQAQNVGLRVLLTGEAGDPLYIAGNEWLADFVTEGRFQDALRGIVAQIRNNGLRYLFTMGHLRPVVRVFLERTVPWLLKVHRLRVSRPAWLKTAAQLALNHERLWVSPALERYNAVLGLRFASHCSKERVNASRHSLDLRYPYRDRRLVEYMISIPAYMLHYGGFYKHVLRIAMKDILPEKIRHRNKATSLESLFRRGMEMEKQVVQEYLGGHREHPWQRFVKKMWCARRLDPSSMLNLSIDSLCISYGMWHKSVIC